MDGHTEVWTYQEGGGEGQMSCSCAKSLHEALDILHRKGVDFDQFMVILVL